MMAFEGGCLCGQLRYASAEAPRFQVVCHCTDCQKSSGSAFTVNLGVRKETLTITGRMTSWEGRADSGNPVLRTFCPDCGSPILTEIALDPGVAILKAGTLDDPSWVRPQRHIFCASRQAWGHLPDDVPTHDRATPPA